MICIELGNNPSPVWWQSFINYVFPPEDTLLVTTVESKEWAEIVNRGLFEFGGRLNRNWEKKYYYITFRQDMNYTLFVLKFN